MEILVEELKLRGYFPNWRDYQIEHVFGKQFGEQIQNINER